MSLKGVVEPLLPEDCFLRSVSSCEHYFEIVKRGRGKKNKLVGSVYESKTRISITAFNPKIKKHIQTMVLITDSPVMVA